jgi:hypothetical protein
MNHNDLLQELAGLTHNERVQRMIALGRRARGNGAAAVLASLQDGGFYERWLALLACYGRPRRGPCPARAGRPLAGPLQHGPAPGSARLQ